MSSPGYILTLLLTFGFTLSTWLQPRAINWNESRAQSDNLLSLTLGDARRMFANHFFVKADVYFHSGYYPSIFDQGAKKEVHISEQAGQDRQAKPGEHEDEPSFLKPPRDWIEKFGRNFMNVEHSHLDEMGKTAEMLPWLRVAAELDPQQIETYTVGAYFLSREMKKPAEAEEFLREGQRANPDSHEILFELGQLYRDILKDEFRARNLFQLAERKLEAQEKKTGEPDLAAKRKILIALSRLEEKAGDIPEAIRYLRQLHDAFPQEQGATRRELEKQIEELTQKPGAGK